MCKFESQVKLGRIMSLHNLFLHAWVDLYRAGGIGWFLFRMHERKWLPRTSIPLVPVPYVLMCGVRHQRHSSSKAILWKMACTVVFIWESTKPHLCSKLSLFKTFWQTLEVQLQLSLLNLSLPYLRPFQWGIVWSNTSQDIKNTTSQSWKFNFYQ